MEPGKKGRRWGGFKCLWCLYTVHEDDEFSCMDTLQIEHREGETVADTGRGSQRLHNTAACVRVCVFVPEEVTHV